MVSLIYFLFCCWQKIIAGTPVREIRFYALASDPRGGSLSTLFTPRNFAEADPLSRRQVVSVSLHRPPHRFDPRETPGQVPPGELSQVLECRPLTAGRDPGWGPCSTPGARGQVTPFPLGFSDSSVQEEGAHEVSLVVFAAIEVDALFKEFIFKSSARFTAKLRGRFRDFPRTPDPAHTHQMVPLLQLMNLR